MRRKALAVSLVGISVAAISACTQEGPTARSLPQASGGSSNGGSSSTNSAAGGNASSNSNQGGTSNSSSSNSQGGTSNSSSSNSQGGTSNSSSSNSQGGTSNSSSSNSQGGTSNSSSSNSDAEGGTSNTSNGSDAAGGSTDSGNSSNAGGTSNTDSSSSAGGASSSSSNTSNSAQTCAHAALPNAKENFLDFSTFTDGKWGAEKGDNAGLTGGTSKYNGTDSTIAYELDSSAGNLKVTATLVSKGYAGLTFWFGPCLDVSTYTGIQLTIGGTTPEKGTKVMVQTNSDYPVDTANKKGGCAWTDESTKWSTCVSPTATITVPSSPAVVKIPFSTVTDGKPNSAVDASELVGFQIQFECPTETDGCTVSVTLDDIGVYK